MNELMSELLGLIMIVKQMLMESRIKNRAGAKAMNASNEAEFRRRRRRRNAFTRALRVETI